MSYLLDLVFGSRIEIFWDRLGSSIVGVGNEI